MAFEELTAKDETELEDLVITHIEAVEPGLVYLDHQRKTESGRLDVLCADQEGVFVVMELKMKEDDMMFMQALEYLDYINENVDRFASFYNRKLKYEKKEIEIDKSSPPRLVLIAPSFSETLRKCAKYLDDEYEISLKQFKILRSKKTGETAPVLIDVVVEAPEIFVEPKTLDDHLGRIFDPKLRDLCVEIVDKIRNVGPDVEVQSRQYWIGFFYRGRRFAAIEPRKSMFHVLVALASRPWREFPSLTVRSREDFTKEFLDKISQRYREVGGR